MPSGAFASPPIIAIALEGETVVVTTPPVVNAAGVTVDVVESSDVAGETVTAAVPLNATGRTTFTKGSSASSFYRLKVEFGEWADGCAARAFQAVSSIAEAGGARPIRFQETFQTNIVKSP